MFFYLYSHYEANSVTVTCYKCFCSDVPFKFVAGILVILSLQYFTPYFYYIPKASLAAVIIAAVVFMVEFHVVKPMWRTKSKSFCNFQYVCTGVNLNVSHMHDRCSSCMLPLKNNIYVLYVLTRLTVNSISRDTVTRRDSRLTETNL
jgi:Sulfate permease and related transporters (MFS superfamily)